MGNVDFGALTDADKKVDDVCIGEADAAVAGGGADEVLLIGAVDVDEAFAGVGVVFGVLSWWIAGTVKENE